MVEEHVRGKQPVKLSVPLTVKSGVAGNDNNVYTIKLAFQGPKGQTFGQSITMQARVTPKTIVEAVDQSTNQKGHWKI